MASPRHPATMENLPNEVLSDIFKRLLAKQLAQMRCVCKPWNALLSDSSFIKSHLHRSINKNDEILLFFHHGMCCNLSLFTARPTCSPNLELTSFIKLPVISQDKSSWSKVIGSMNGLICFSYYSNNDYAVGIWNPSLSAMLALPPSSFSSRNFLEGFGFDPKTDDYKVVKQDEVYSMRKGSWASISQRFSSPITPLQGNRYCVDGLVGHLHWLGTTHSERKPCTIVAFDLGAETFREIPLPDSLPHHNGYRYNVLGVLGGKLCVMLGVRDGKFEVWVMEEYGVADSWVKHHAFSQFGGDIVPYGFTSHSEFLFQVDKNENRSALYDPVAAKTKSVKITGGLGNYRIVEYVDSLVWVARPKRDHAEASLSFIFE